MWRPGWPWTSLHPKRVWGPAMGKFHFLLVLMLCMCVKHSYGLSCGDVGDGQVLVENPKDGACGDIDIRNSVKNLRKLENCTVIEGSLHISLIDYVPMEEYDKYSFPELKEITGHLMMFRVFGLRTLRKLFPNLAVIRGQTLFFNDYALVAFEMRDLEELGLVSLTTILKGAVRLTKNHKLCHISSIDWGRLAVGVQDPSEHQFIDNREEQLCPDYCSPECPITTYNGITRRRCWTSNSSDCQGNLNCRCAGRQACYGKGKCCNAYCLGGCSGPLASDCFACKDVIYKNECKPVCPYGTYMLSNHRCLTDRECLDLQPRSPRDGSSDASTSVPKLLERDQISRQPGLCVYKCPPNYVVAEDMDNSHGDAKKMAKCIPCKHDCPKVCNTTVVNSLEDSEKLIGCSKIEGNLVLTIMSGKNIDYELTKNLGNIREVTDYIKIMRSYALLTLHFFQKLEIIGGEKLAHKMYSLIVVDNTNLQEIFPKEQMKKMSIKRGAVSFHGNRKLCYSKIANFTKAMNITPQVDEKGVNLDMSNTTNGDLIPCREEVLELDLYLQKGSRSTAILKFEKYSSGDIRQLINYIAHYKIVHEPVRDIFQGRDACSENEWTTIDIKPEDNPENHQLYFLTHLKPFTRYAVYIQAYTLPTASASAMTKIHYFQTSPFNPTEPIELEVTSNDPHELVVKWKPPKSPNGIVTHYKVFYQLQSSNMKGFEQRDYCSDPIMSARELQKKAEEKKLEEEKKKKKEGEKENDPKCCECPKTKQQLLKEQRITELEIAFENHLHSNVYKKKWNDNCVDISFNIPESLDDIPSAQPKDPLNTRLRRDARKTGLDFNNPIKATPSKRKDPDPGAASAGDADLDEFADTNATNSSTAEPPNTVPTQEVIVYNDTKVTLSNLEHFREYNIEVVACHETDPDTGTKLCGNSAITTGQTTADPPSDNLNSSLVSVETMANKSGEVFVRWHPPLRPNGLILKYNIKYKRVDLDREPIPVIKCVNPKQYHNSSNGHLLQGLAPGNYSIQISAYSLAGNGSYTTNVYFSVAPPHGGEEGSTPGLYIGVTVAIIFILIITVIVVYRVVKAKYSPSADVIVSPNPHYIPTDELYAPDEWEVDRDTIRLIKELGQGSFGTVFEGLMENKETSETIPVAIKTVNDKADFHERLKILKEATTMKVFECHHVVKLLGVVSKGQPALVIMELMALGDLRNYLRKCRVDEEEFPDFHPPTANQIRQMAGEIADGMAYLADKKIVHRDLAARNCLVAEDGTVKIADFGMARDVYMTEYYRKDQKALLPVRWMAPESLKDGIFTTMSDIWSYGIVLWEMVTLAEQPYQGLGNDEVLRYVTEGRVMAAPLNCPVDLYDMMQRCWAYNPKHRPTFKYLIELLVPYLSDQFREVSYFFKEVVRSDAEDEDEEEEEDKMMEESEMEEDMEDDMEDMEDEDDDCVEDKPEADRDLRRDEEKLMLAVSDGEDSLMAGGSPYFYANSSDDDHIRDNLDDIDDDDDERRSNPYLMSGPARISPSPSSPTSSRTPAHQRGAGGQRGERSPLLLHQGNVQQPPLLSPSSGAAMLHPTDFDNDGDDDDSDHEFQMDDKYARPSKDAKSPSERLKLLPDSPGNAQAKLGVLSGPSSSPSPYHNRKGTSEDAYTVMSPRASSSASSRYSEDKNPFSSPSLPLSPTSPSTSQSASTSSNPPPFSLAPLLPSISQPTSSSPYMSLSTSPPSSSSKPTLHVDMEGVGGSHNTNSKQSPPFSKGAGHAGGGGDADRHGWLHQNNNLLQKSGSSSSNKNPVSSGSDSNTNSIQSGSEGSGSKESSSSSGSHHRFANGHGPFTHQQAALC